MALPNNPLATLITQARAYIKPMLTDFDPEITDFVQLKNQVLQLQLQQIDKSLSTALTLNESEAKDYLKKLFAAYWKQTKNTALSYQARPEGFANRFMWRLARLVFKPTTLEQMLALLMPDVDRQLIVTVEKPSKDQKLAAKDLVIKLSEEPLEGFLADEQQLEMSALSRLLVAGNTVFDVAQVTEFTLDLQAKLYLALDSRSQLKTLLYQHNDDFSAIVNQIELDPKFQLEQLAKVLIRSGSSITGRIYASDDAVVAAANFNAYINRLPEQSAKEFLALRHEQISIQDILTRLAQGDCVEVASVALKNIVNNEDNIAQFAAYKSVLIQTNGNNRYSCAEVGFDKTQQLPVALVKPLLQRIELSSIESYLMLLINMPLSEYPLLFQYATLAIPQQLASVLSDGILSDQQLGAFIEGLMRNQQLDEQALLNFIKQTNNFVAFKIALSALDDEPARFRVLQISNDSDSPLLYWANQSDKITAIMKSFASDEGRLAAISIPDKSGQNLLHHHSASQRPLKKIKAILAAFTDDAFKLAALSKLNQHGETVLHGLGSDVVACKAILDCFTNHQHKLALINTHNAMRQPVLSAAVDSLDSFELFFNLYPDDQAKLKVLAHTTKLTDPLLFQITKPEVFRLIMENLSSDQHRLAVMKMQNKEGDNFLQHYLKKIATDNTAAKMIRTMLDYLPNNSQRLLLVSLSEADYLSKLNGTLTDQDCIKTFFLHFYPDDQARIEALNSQDKSGNSLLMRAVEAKHYRVVSAMLSAFSDSKNRFILLNQAGKNGVTAWQLLAANDKQAQALFEVINDGCTMPARQPALNNEAGQTRFNEFLAGLKAKLPSEEHDRWQTPVDRPALQHCRAFLDSLIDGNNAELSAGDKLCYLYLFLTKKITQLVYCQTATFNGAFFVYKQEPNSLELPLKQMQLMIEKIDLDIIPSGQTAVAIDYQQAVDNALLEPEKTAERALKR